MQSLIDRCSRPSAPSSACGGTRPAAGIHGEAGGRRPASRPRVAAVPAGRVAGGAAWPSRTGIARSRAAVRMLTRHPGEDEGRRSARRALVTFPHTFADREPGLVPRQGDCPATPPRASGSRSRSRWMARR